MADVVTTESGAAPVAAKPSTSKKAVKARKPPLPAEHPKYREMITAAIAALKERGGSSRQAILKYILGHFKVGSEVSKINGRVKVALRAGIKSGVLKQSKGTGASGSFRLGERPRAAAKPKAATARKPAQAAKKPAARKAPSKTSAKRKSATPKKALKPKAAAAARKAGAKKSPKKVAAAKKPKAKSPKKLAKPGKKMGAKKSPAKKASKPKLTKK